MSLYNKKIFKDKKNHKRTNSFKDFYNNIIFSNENFNNAKNNNNNNNIFKNSDNKKFNINLFFNNNNKNNFNLNRPFTQNFNDKFNVKKNYFNNNNNKDIISNNFYNTLFHFPSANKSFYENKKIEDDYLKLTNNFENNIINKKETKNDFDLNNIITNFDSNNIENNNNNNNNNNNINNNNNLENNNNNNNIINTENKNNFDINKNNFDINKNNNNIINNDNYNINNNINNKNLNKNNFLKNNLFRPYKSKIPIAQNFNTYLYKTNLSYRNYINSNNKIYSSYLTKQNLKNNLNTIFNYKNNNSTLTPNISTINSNIDSINNNNNKTIETKSISSYNNKLSNINSKKNIKSNNFKINYSSFSKAGCSNTGVPKTNQDNFYTQSSKITNSYIEYTFGVFDGHGTDGHLVSQTLKSFFETQPFTNLNSKENLKSTFNSLSNSINNTKNINTFISGSTCVLVHVSNRKILCANVGDSRAIVVYDMNNKNLIIKNLSFDHKPENFEEKKRIEKMGGRVERIFNDFGPYRVWFKNENFPGLAMSRSFGDKAAHSVGVIDEPDIIEMDVFSEDFGKAVCVIIASDGVWEFVGNEYLKEIVGKYLFSKNAKDCVKDIVDKSRQLWERSGFAIDDITCVVGFFDYEEDNNINNNIDCNNNNYFNINEEKNI